MLTSSLMVNVPVAEVAVKPVGNVPTVAVQFSNL
jgi:hypothetical protein